MMISRIVDRTEHCALRIAHENLDALRKIHETCQNLDLKSLVSDKIKKAQAEYELLTAELLTKL